MTFNDDELVALDSGVARIGIFFRIATDSPVRLWLGFGDIKPGVNVHDLEGATYHGLGELNDIPEINQMINGAAERVEFTLSGVSGDVFDIASGDDADDIKGKAVAVGLGIFGATWQLLGPVHWFGHFEADYISQRQSESGDPAQPIIRSIALSCGSIMTGRRRPSHSYFTDQDQQHRHPGDLFCSLVGRYAHGFNKAWPKFPDPD